MRRTNFISFTGNPIKILYTDKLNIRYPVYLETDLIIQNPVAFKGVIILASIDNECRYIRFKVGDGETPYNSLPFINKDSIEALSDLKVYQPYTNNINNNDINNSKITIEFDNEELMILRSVCKSSILQEQSVIETATSDDVKETAQREIETLYGLVNKIKRSINTFYGDKLKIRED
jgi:hypothetical protein